MNVGSSDNIHMYLYERWYGGVLVGALNPDGPIGAAGNYTFSPMSPMTISEAGVYSIVIQPDFVEGTSMTWFNSITDDGGAYSEAVGTTWGPWNNSPDAATYRVYGTVVPEPGTIALFMLGLSCIIAKRKIKR